MTLSVSHLVGGYSQIPVLKDISFEVHPHELVGLIGLNGAGKSTTIKHIIGLLNPIKGKITIDGTTLTDDPETYKTKLAYIPETPVLYDELTLKEHLELTMMAYNLDHTKAWGKANQLLKMFRLNKKLDWFPANFSKGMRQKVMIICAFITNAKVFIIDEPFYGLDPIAIRDLTMMIDDVKNHGAAVLMSTHVLETAQKVCDRFVMLRKGEIAAQGNLQSLQNQMQKENADLSEIYLEMMQGESANE